LENSLGLTVLIFKTLSKTSLLKLSLWITIAAPSADPDARLAILI